MPTQETRMNRIATQSLTLAALSLATSAFAASNDGSVDVLSQPDDPAVIEDIKEWSSRQPAQAPGTVTPTVVNLQPLPAEDRATPAPVRVSPVASSASCSRALGSAPPVTDDANANRSSVVLPIAETTATTSNPAARSRAIRATTAAMRSTEPTELPPYF
jgi:hypothetical protein